MKWIGLVGSAIVLYALMVACVIGPNSTHAGANSAMISGEAAPGDAKSPETPEEMSEAIAPRAGHVSVEGLPYRGATMQLQRVDWMDKYKQSVDEIAAVGFDTVKFVVDARQENGKSSRIYLDLRMTPTAEALADLIQHAKKKGLRVILMPIVLLDAPIGGEWRGTIHPEDWKDWWESYRAMLDHYSWVAEANHVDVLVIGSELVSTESNIEEWTRTINGVRSRFHGRITYSSNWDHYTSVPFWDQLDLIGMNSYWKMTGDDNRGEAVTLEDIKDHWKHIQKDLLPWVKKTHKPLLFLEIGWFSQVNTAFEPWDYTKPVTDEPIDLQLQKRLYEGFFESWQGEPLLGGFNIWEWTPGGGGPTDAGYTPENKPAEKVLRDWLAKKPWEVKVN